MGMHILGIDEAGRGPVIGSMMIAGVLVDDEGEKRLREIGVKDSKMLSRQERDKLAEEIGKIAKEVHVIEVTANEIDNMRRVMSLNEIEAGKVVELLERFEERIDKAYIDCPDPVPDTFIARLKALADLDMGLVVEHKADARYPVVSAASIIAKAARDAHVDKLSKKHGVKLGTGYPHDPDAINAIEEHLNRTGKLPPYVRKSWDTSKRLLEKRTQRKLSDF